MRTAIRFLIVVTSLHASLLSAATRTWTGAASNLWSNPANWGGAAPAPGDDLVFPGGAANQTNQNDYPAGTAFHSLSYPGPAGYTVTGNAIILGAGGITANDGSDLFQLPLTLAASQTWTFTGVEKFTLQAPIALAGRTLTVNQSALFPGFLALLSNIGGSGALVTTGTGVIELQGASTYAGPTTINGAHVSLAGVSPLGLGDGTAANGTVVNGGSIGVVGTVGANEWIAVFGNGDGSGVIYGSNGSLAGTLVLADANVAFGFNESLRLAAKVTGPGGIQLSGGGLYKFANPADDFAGPLQITGPFQTTIMLDASNVLPSHLSLNLLSNSTLNLNAFSNTLRSLTGTGSVLGRDGALTLTEPAVFSGSFTSTSFDTGGSVTLIGSGGPWNFNGSSPNTPATLHLRSRAEVAIIGGAYSGPIVAHDPDTLVDVSGSTVVGPVTITAGALGVGYIGGTRVATSGNLAFGPQTGFYGSIGGGGMPSSSQLNVTGTVALNGGVALHLLLQAPPALGQQFRIINNDGADPVSGTFAGLPEGATYATGVADFRITYAGGDGNDVVLITVAHSTTTLSQSSTSTSTGQPVTFTAFVSGSGTPTGTVTFRDGTTVLGTSPLNASAVATLTTSSLANGSHPITAFYNGDAANGGSPSNQIQHDVLDPATIPTLDAKGLAALALLLGIAAMFVLRRH